MGERALRLGGVAVLLALALAVGWSWVLVRDPARPWALTVELGGTIDHYDADTVVVATTTRGRRPVVITPATIVTEVGVATDVSALRPDRFVVVRGDVPAWGRRLVARRVMVW